VRDFARSTIRLRKEGKFNTSFTAEDQTKVRGRREWKTPQKKNQGVRVGMGKKKKPTEGGKEGKTNRAQRKGGGKGGFLRGKSGKKGKKKTGVRTRKSKNHKKKDWTKERQKEVWGGKWA